MYSSNRSLKSLFDFTKIFLIFQNTISKIITKNINLYYANINFYEIKVLKFYFIDFQTIILLNFTNKNRLFPKFARTVSQKCFIFFTI